MRIFEEEDNGQGSGGGGGGGGGGGSMPGDTPAHNNRSSSSGMDFEYKGIKKSDKASQYYSDDLVNATETLYETAQVHTSDAGGDGAMPEGIDDDPDDLGSGDGIHLGNGLGLRLHGPSTNSSKGGKSDGGGKSGGGGGGGSKAGGGKSGGGKDKKDKDKEKDKDKKSDKEKKKDKDDDEEDKEKEKEKEKDSDEIDSVPNGKGPTKSELCQPPEPEPLDCGTQCLYISIQCCECIII